MSIPPCGTFHYAGLAAGAGLPAREWRLVDESGAPSVLKKPVTDNRLVGLHPRLEVSGGRLILSATDPERAQVASASFELDRGLVGLFAVGDLLHLARTPTGDLGVSLSRDDQLIFAVGAITHVPLRADLAVRNGPARTPWDEWPRRETWVDVSAGSEGARLRAGEQATIGNYKFCVVRSYVDGVPGQCESLAISFAPACPHDASLRAASELAEARALAMKSWAEEQRSG